MNPTRPACWLLQLRYGFAAICLRLSDTRMIDNVLTVISSSCRTWDPCCSTMTTWIMMIMIMIMMMMMITSGQRILRERPHRHVVALRGSEWIFRPLLHLIYASIGPRESASKRHLDRFSRLSRLTTDRHTHTDRSRYSLRSNRPLSLANATMRPNNKVDVLHVRLTELHAAHQNLPCYLLIY